MYLALWQGRLWRRSKRNKALRLELRSRRKRRLKRLTVSARYYWQTVWLGIALFAACVLGLVIGINYRD
jgi:uncharacterized membrane protein